MYKSVLSNRITSLYASQHASVVFACKTAPFGTELHVSVWTRPHLSFCACKTARLAPEWLVSMGPSRFYMQNSDFWSRITTLYGSQTTPVFFWMQNSVNSIRITSLYGSLPSSEVFGCKTATFWPELQVSMGPKSHLSFCAWKTAWFALVWLVYMGSTPHQCFFSCKTATLGPDLQVSMGPRLHMWFWAHITACLAQE